ncbi:hypothetical protein FE697_014115 [Mumia zhuanghuii]|uniref:Uncharacterized protein n=2 Tax=Mumia TaxID=1546255 RepID=A0ABW1QLF6_9ACTN|nr:MULTISPECIES: hypothetical protein [Mumia]KAA1422293.1 hypothetical protein FE697_014115 [Mumia zhuanghuii]
MTEADPDLHAPIRSQQDLLDRWTTLMGELGFSRRSLWFAVVDPDRRLVSPITQIADIPPSAEPDKVAALLTMTGARLAEVGPDASIAFLLSRPGYGGMDAADRSWARLLASTARYLRVPIETIHLATDDTLTAFAPDDLAA